MLLYIVQALFHLHFTLSSLDLFFVLLYDNNGLLLKMVMKVHDILIWKVFCYLIYLLLKTRSVMLLHRMLVA
jgi:hypothetical protein